MTMTVLDLGPGITDPGLVDDVVRPDPEVPERARRRTFTAKYKLEVLAAYDAAVAARERGRGHGRVETRSISVVSLHPCPDVGGEFFPHAAQAINLDALGPAEK